MTNTFDKSTDNLIQRALQEDSAQNDITSKYFIPSTATSIAKIFFKESAVVCGVLIAKKVFQRVDPNLVVTIHKKDNQIAHAHQHLLTISGKTRSILAAERTALNFISHLSAISTQTKSFVDAVKGTSAKILDTRKTTPGLRHLEKYAVRCGGGENHRMDLVSMALIKDNHKVQCGESIWRKIRIFQEKTKKPLEVEVENLKELQLALIVQPTMILLDNMSINDMKKAVQIVKRLKGKKPLLEASGGINLKNILLTAKTGVDRISIGALTHHVHAIDISLELTHEKN